MRHKERARGNLGFLGVLSWITFFAQAKKVIKNPLTRPRCGRMGISKQKLFSSPTDSRAQRALVKEFMFISLRLAKKRTKETSRRHLRFLRHLNGGRFSSAFKIHLPPTAPRWRGVSRGISEVAARGRHWLGGDAHPPPFRQRPARFGQKRSCAPLQNASVPVSRAAKSAEGVRGSTRLCAPGREVSDKTRTPCESTKNLIQFIKNS